MPNVTDATDTYGYIADLARQIPELNAILNRAISGAWTPSKFQNAVQDSTWWKTHSDSVRQRLVQKSTDPGSYKQDLAEAYRRVDQMAGQTGLHLDLHKRNFAAQQILAGGWSDVDLHSYLGSHGAFTNGGEVEQTRAKMRTLMGDYGLGASPGQVDYAVRRVLAGADTIDTWQARWRKQAESMFPGLKAELEQGQTVRQIADPYVSQYAQTLELDPAGIDITKDPLLRRALTTKDTQGHPSTMPLWQFEQELRKDSRYDKTNGAKNETYDLINQIGKDWGYHG